MVLSNLAQTLEDHRKIKANQRNRRTIQVHTFVSILSWCVVDRKLKAGLQEVVRDMAQGL